MWKLLVDHRGEHKITFNPPSRDDLFDCYWKKTQWIKQALKMERWWFHCCYMRCKNASVRRGMIVLIAHSKACCVKLHPFLRTTNLPKKASIFTAMLWNQTWLWANCRHVIWLVSICGRPRRSHRHTLSHFPKLKVKVKQQSGNLPEATSESHRKETPKQFNTNLPHWENHQKVLDMWSCVYMSLLCGMLFH